VHKFGANFAEDGLTVRFVEPVEGLGDIMGCLVGCDFGLLVEAGTEVNPEHRHALVLRCLQQRWQLVPGDEVRCQEILADEKHRYLG
jgi:hypothetical protein